LSIHGISLEAGLFTEGREPIEACDE